MLIRDVCSNIGRERINLDYLANGWEFRKIDLAQSTNRLYPNQISWLTLRILTKFASKTEKL